MVKIAEVDCIALPEMILLMNHCLVFDLFWSGGELVGGSVLQHCSFVSYFVYNNCHLDIEPVLNT